ncbi:TolC family protein [Syntrophorhabdus aromaticivorans]|uniref:TolC family protein n=1 Tax=Syntrophorhabdus aromaticivorans TaxID=328301 RepID=UPI00041361AA|nr:TolC family protein [Syntrophorhabdus aromaticivorans]
MAHLKHPVTLILTVFIFWAFLPARLAAEKLTLPEGLRVVTEENRIVKLSRQDELITEADTRVARSGLLPHVYGSYTQNYNEKQQGARIGNSSVYTQQKDFHAYSLTVQQLLWDFGGILSAYRASKKILETRQYDYKRTKNFVALLFTTGYLDLLESEKMVTVGEKEVERLESHLKTARSLYSEGVITRNDLLQAEVRLSDARQKLLTAKNMRQINVSRLNNMLVRPLTSTIQAEEIAGAGLEPVDLDRAFERAEKERYEVRIVDATLEAVDFEATAKKAEYFPRFFVEGGYNYVENRYALYDGSWAVIGGMSINFLSGGSTKAGLDRIHHQKNKLITERKKLIEDIRFEVERYYLELANAREKVKVTKDATFQAEENLRINNIKYREGEGTATDVIDAITLLTIAETNHHKSRYDLLRAEAGFMHAMGQDLLEVYR